jgi:hypothetical protein
MFGCWFLRQKGLAQAISDKFDPWVFQTAVPNWHDSCALQGMLYWKPIEVRAFLRRWTVLKALIAALMLAAPSLPGVAGMLDGLGAFRSEALAFWYLLTVVIWLWGSADYARSKGYSGWWGMLCAPLPFGPFGLVILFLMPDRWDPRFENWAFESSPLLIDGERMCSSREARGRLKKSWMQKYRDALILWAFVAVYQLVLKDRVSAGTRETLGFISLAGVFVALFLGVWGAAHLARHKGYSPYWAATGFAVVPFAGIMSYATAPDVLVIGLLLMAFWVGPIALLIMPDQWSDVGVSPMEYNPNELRDLEAEPEFVDQLPHVRIVNPY